MNILLASNNAKKRKELERILSALELHVVTPKDLGLAIDPDETGSSFAENALIKARTFAAHSELLVLGDDSGLCVDALDGAPGIRSARFAGEKATDSDNRAKLLRELAAAPSPRTAHFTCALALVRGDQVLAEVEGRCAGVILDTERGSGGFGYDPLFVPDRAASGRTFAELDDATKDDLSHRGVALRELAGTLLELARQGLTVDASTIRNFCIIAHIDHGKSTLADRFLELTGTVRKEALLEQMMDGMDLERERGITIKAKAVTLHYKAKDGITYQLNLIDTPGHVDFSYEVSKALQACEGAFLLIDAAQGIEAQTVANAHLAEKAKLHVIPVINKIDLPTARPETIEDELEHILLMERERVLRCSAKTGQGVIDLLEAVVTRIPQPKGAPDGLLRALVFDAVFDDYRGVIIHVRVFDGSLKKGDRIRMKGVSSTYEVHEVGYFHPRQLVPQPVLFQGEVGYMICNVKTLSDVRIGDTVCREKEAASIEALPGYQPPQHMVFCGIYPVNNMDFENLRKALDKLALNDASFSYAPESSEALGFGFRCGFLGLLHMEIVQERLERESNIDIVQTAPNVTYEVLTSRGEVNRIESPSQLPDPTFIEELREPVVKLDIITPAEYVGALITLGIERRGKFKHQEYISETRVMLTFEVPLAEIIFDFYDNLKSITRGYGTMDYEVLGYQAANLVKMRILVSSAEVDALSTIVHRDQAEYRGRKMLQALREEIPRHMFEVALQAAIGGKIIARESIRAMSKNVTAKCYGGDVTRKRKLLEKQKEGKRRMKMVGRVEIPQKAFLSVLSVARNSEK